MNKSGSIKKGRFSVSQGKVGYNTSSTKKGRFNVSKGTEGFNTTPKKQSSKNPRRRILNNTRTINRTRTNSRGYNNRLGNNENFVMTKNEKKHIEMYMFLTSKASLKGSLKKEIKSADRELDIIMKNKYFNPFNTSVSMVPFTRWKNDITAKPENKIYEFTHKKYKKLMKKIENLNETLIEYLNETHIKLLQQKINRAVIKYNKMRKNEYIRSIYKKIDSLRKKLDKNNVLTLKELSLLFEKIKELNKFGNDTGRRLN